MVRCFVGLMLPEKTKEAIKLIKDKIMSLPIRAKPVEDHNLHICFSFLGEVDENRIDSISATLDKISKEFSIFEVGISNIKLIPNEKYIRVLVLDVFDSEAIKNLGYLIKKSVGGDVKPPHITLCRVKGITDKQNTIKKIKEIEVKTKKFTVDRVQLIKSELRRTGPIYTVLHESLFKTL